MNRKELNTLKKDMGFELNAIERRTLITQMELELEQLDGKVQYIKDQLERVRNRIGFYQQKLSKLKDGSVKDMDIAYTGLNSLGEIQASGPALDVAIAVFCLKAQVFAKRIDALDKKEKRNG